MIVSLFPGDKRRETGPQNKYPLIAIDESLQKSKQSAVPLINVVIEVAYYVHNLY